MSELKVASCFEFEKVLRGKSNKLFYPKSEVDAAIAELKAREDVLVTDNRDLLENVKKLENLLRENAEHFKRNEAQIIENADKEIAEKDKEIARLDDLAHAHNIELLRKENLIAELKSLKQALMADDLRYRYRIRRHKYKRCLYMAKWCFTKSNYHFAIARHGEYVKDNNRKSLLYSKWHNRWLKIAEKFKEAK